VRLSDDKISHLSHVLLAALQEYADVDYRAEDNQVRLMIKEALVESLVTLDELEEKVSRTLQSYSRKIVEGSREWDLMYSKTYEEELQKLKVV
jgi:hypothetical protein